VTYQPYSPGLHNVDVSLNGTQLGAFPKKVDVTAGPATVMGNFEMDIWRELNKARMNPTMYAGYLRDILPNYDQNTGAFNIPDSDYVRQTQEGRKAVQEGIRYLEGCQPTSSLKISEPFSNSCRDLVADLSPKGATGNILSDGTDPATRLNRYGRWKSKVGEILSYGAYSARDVVTGWIIDDGIGNRPNRMAIFDPDFTVVGIASGPHAKQIRMVACALAGNFVEGDEAARQKREVKVNIERETLKFDRFETADKSGYLIPVGNLGVDVNNLKLFKEGRQLHIEKTVMTSDNEPLVSDYRYDVPYDFEPILVTSKLHPLTNELFLYLAKPAGSLDPNKEEVITSFTMGPNLKRPNEKMEMTNSQTPDYIQFNCKSSTSKEEITIMLKGKVMIILAKRFVIQQDEQGEFENVITSKRSVNIPFPVTLGQFNLVREGDDGFSIKILKPTSSVAPDQKVEIPIQKGTFDL